MASNVIEASAADFDQIVMKSDIPVLLDFWASWCGPCQALNPVIEQLADDFVGRAKIVKIDIEKDQDLASEFGVRSIPHLTIVKKGEANQTIASVRTLPGLSKLLSAFVDRSDVLRALKEDLDDPEIRRTYFETASIGDLIDAITARPDYVNAPIDDEFEISPATHFLLNDDRERFAVFRNNGAVLSATDLAMADLNGELYALLQSKTASAFQGLRSGTEYSDLLASILHKPDQLEIFVRAGINMSALADIDRDTFYRQLINSSFEDETLLPRLMDAGLNYSTETEEGLTAYHFACVLQRVDTKIWLLENGFGPEDR